MSTRGADVGHLGPSFTSRSSTKTRISRVVQIYKLPARTAAQPGSFMGAGSGYNRREREDGGRLLGWRTWTAGVMFPCPCMSVDDPKPHVCKCQS